MKSTINPTGFVLSEARLGKENSMSKQFKAMKFWIGDDPLLAEKVSDLLESVGYSVGYKNYRFVGSYYTREDGAVGYCQPGNAGSSYYRNHGSEEINIDWMRTSKKETIELNGKKYLKEDLEEALKHLKAVDE